MSETIHGFERVEEKDIPELNTRARLFRHIQTGAELLSLENEDENKVFGITFRTPPNDSTGVPHIMEHAVLCGSRKYPVKEPFVELIKGSLKTFLNAFTFPDKTCYPVASQNLQDFYNLIDVYVDAVFHPLISPYTLQQEGWHYELGAPDAPLTYKGVVFNEMKGAYSSPESLLIRQSQQSLFPSNTYGVDSGGDPTEIPNLTYEQFKRFHDTHYHPSNARIFFYGDDDPEERLRRMNEYLGEFQAQPVNSRIDLQESFEEPRRVTIPYDAGEAENEKKAMVTVNWLLTDSKDPQTALALRILTHILIGTPASPLRKALIDSGLGDDLVGAGLEDELRQAYFSTGLKGTALEDTERVEQLILNTLEELAETGLDPDTVAASLNTIEFRLRENNTGSFPRGLLLMLRSLTTWLYEQDPLAPLAFEAPLAAIKKELEEDERYFEKLIRRFWLNNPHRTTVIMKPEPGLAQKKEAAERERLEKVREKLDETELQAVLENTRELNRRQQTPDPPEALAKIPALELEDIDRKIKTIPLEVSDFQGTPVLFHDLFTNGIFYLDLGFDLHNLPQEYLPYVPLFSQALLEMGTQSEDFVKLSQRIGRETGGIYPTSFTSVVPEEERSAAWLFLRGKATVDQAGELLAIFRDVLQTVRLDNPERFRQMVLEARADQETMLVPGGHRVVNARLRALFDEAGWAAEQMSGISYLFFLRELAQAVGNDWPGVLEKLEAIRALLVNRSGMLCNVTLDAENWRQVRPQLEDFLSSLPAESRAPANWVPVWSPGFEGLTIPAQVNYVGKGANLYKLGYRLDGSIFVITNYLRTTWLWEKIRVQGGAYGGFNNFDFRSGVYTLLSYRDPNLVGTLENYDRAGWFLREAEISRDEITRSIIGAIGDMDAYQLPDAKGYSSMLRYLTGDSDEKRQRRRDEVLAASVEDFRAFAGIMDRVAESGQVVVLGAQEAIQNAGEEMPFQMEIKRVL